MNGLQTSAVMRRIESQLRERWHHKPTNKRYVLILEGNGACELQGLDGRSTYAMRADLENNEVWERLP